MSDALPLILETARRRATIAPAVLDVLRRQNARWGPSARRDAHLDALARGAVAVVTGQQLGIALGPLYTVYKAASAVRLAQQITDAGVPAVPTFWLQAEDHDWDEVRTLRWPSGGVVREASLPPRPEARARTSLAHERVGEGIGEVLAAVESELRASEHGAAFFARLREHYRAESTMVDAFGGLLTEFFERWGLLTIQPRDEALAPIAARVHRRALEDHEAISARLVARAAELEKVGAKVPIPVRADCALSFFHPEGAEGPRYRLAPRDDGYALSGSDARFSKSEILRRLETSPMDFSTSALLRPLLQDMLLPTAVYVGGPSEVAYAEQLRGSGEHCGVGEHWEIELAPFVRRASFQILSAQDREDLAALELNAPSMLAADEGTLMQRLGRGPISDELEALAAHVKQVLAKVGPEIAALDPGLGKTATKTEETIEHALSKLQSRAERAASTRHPEKLAQLRRVRARLQPGGEPQERVHGLPAIAALGVDRVVEAAVERSGIAVTEDLML